MTKRAGEFKETEFIYEAFTPNPLPSDIIHDEYLSCAYASEKVLARDWDTREEDEAWSNL